MICYMFLCVLFREEAKKVAKVKDALKMKIVPMHGSLPAAEQVDTNPLQ